jgi:hypothetical protein
MADPEAYKLDKLIVTAKQLGASNLYLVKLIGMGDQFQTSVEARSAKEAALHVVEELTFASHHPHKFFNRRKLAAQQSGARGHDFDKLIEVANEAVGYAALNKVNLVNAVYAIDDDTVRRLG